MPKWSIIKVNIDAASATLGVQNLQKQISKADQDLEAKNVKMTTYFNYGMHLSNILVNQLAKTAEGTQYEAGMQALLAGVNIAQTELSIINLSQRAFANLADPATTALGVLQLSIAGAMQYTLVQQQLNKARLDAIQGSIKSFQTFREMYS